MRRVDPCPHRPRRTEDARLALPGADRAARRAVDGAALPGAGEPARRGGRP
ncbi:hypothetical protein ACMHYB_37660 [Sorangium sp. So ce1128]